jgi:hypothetical protein
MRTSPVTSAGGSLPRTARSSPTAEGYRHKGYAIAMAEKLNPNAELVIEDETEG